MCVTRLDHPVQAFDTGDALVREGFEIGGVEHFGGDNSRDVLVANVPAPELLSGPIPALRDGFFALLIAAPAIEAGGVGAVRIKAFDIGDVAVGDLGHRRMQPGDGRLNRVFEFCVGHPENSL